MKSFEEVVAVFEGLGLDAYDAFYAAAYDGDTDRLSAMLADLGLTMADWEAYYAYTDGPEDCPEDDWLTCWSDPDCDPWDE